jgi:hypothetical protein
MSSTEPPMSTVVEPAAIDPIRALASENAALVLQLRAVQIPQHVGMAAACRALASDLPRELMRQLDGDLASGALSARWDAVRTIAAEASAGGDIEVTVATLATLLREQTRTMTRYLAARAKEWTADAYRLEGQAAALEQQAERLRSIASPPPAAGDAAPPSEGAVESGPVETAG